VSLELHQAALAFAAHWGPTLGKGVWEAWLEKQEGPREAHHVMPDIQPFVANTGVRIESRAQWNEHLKRTNSVELSRADLKHPSEVRMPHTKGVEAAGRKEAVKLALDKITKYGRPRSEVRALLDNVVRANRRK